MLLTAPAKKTLEVLVAVMLLTLVQAASAESLLQL